MMSAMPAARSCAQRHREHAAEPTPNDVSSRAAVHQPVPVPPAWAAVGDPVTAVGTVVPASGVPVLVAPPRLVAERRLWPWPGLWATLGGEATRPPLCWRVAEAVVARIFGEGGLYVCPV